MDRLYADGRTWVPMEALEDLREVLKRISHVRDVTEVLEKTDPDVHASWTDIVEGDIYQPCTQNPGTCKIPGHDRLHGDRVDATGD